MQPPDAGFETLRICARDGTVANEKHVAILKSGLKAWNAWRL